MNTTKSSKTLFLDMNDDCIEAIFSWLSLDELCIMSTTCQRIQCIASAHFHHEYSSKCIRMVNGSEIDVKNHTRKSFVRFDDIVGNYKKCFSSHIRCITIQETHSHPRLPVIEYFKFLKSNCCENLKILELKRIDHTADDDCGQYIRKQLSNLKAIRFIDCDIDDIHNEFLQYCSNLRHLWVSSTNQSNYGFAWTQKRYPKLESLLYCVVRDDHYADLGRFFSLNRQIKTIETSNERTMNTITANGIECQQLILRFSGSMQRDIFLRVCNDLKSYCSRGHCEQLALYFTENIVTYEELSHIKSFASMEQFQQLHIMIDNIEDILVELSSLKYLKCLSLDHCAFGNSISSKIPFYNLEKLYLTHNCFHDVTVIKAITPFVRQLEQLKEVVLCNYITTKMDIVKLNRIRSQLKNACPLAIYVHESYLKSTNFVVPDGSLVTMKSHSDDVFWNHLNFNTTRN